MADMKRKDILRRDALRWYLIYRIKLLELIHFHLLWKALEKQNFTPENLLGHDGGDFANSVRTAALSWFATLVDQSRDGMDVFQLWRQLFRSSEREFSHTKIFDRTTRNN